MDGSRELSYRHSNAAYWWVASELVRRHPTLRLRDASLQDGFYDMLKLEGDAGGRAVDVSFNRGGSIHVFHVENPPHMTAADVLGHDDGHWAVKKIESALGLPSSAKAPSSTPKSLAFRLIARLLTTVASDRSLWDARMITVDDYPHSVALHPPSLPKGQKHPFPRVFASDHDFAAFMMTSGLPGQWEPGRFWAILRDDEAVAVVDTLGLVFTRTGRQTLPAVYAAQGRNVSRLMVALLGDLMP